MLRAPEGANGKPAAPAVEATYSAAGLRNGGDGARLEPNHSHFVLVDSGAVGGKAWGCEIPTRCAVESHICEHYHVPMVQVVVNGGPGTVGTIKVRPCFQRNRLCMCLRLSCAHCPAPEKGP